jgi:hypothetical protein
MHGGATGYPRGEPKSFSNPDYGTSGVTSYEINPAVTSGRDASIRAASIDSAHSRITTASSRSPRDVFHKSDSQKAPIHGIWTRACVNELVNWKRHIQGSSPDGP